MQIKPLFLFTLFFEEALEPNKEFLACTNMQKATALKFNGISGLTDCLFGWQTSCL